MSYFRLNLDVGDQDNSMYTSMVDFAVTIPNAWLKMVDLLTGHLD